LVEQPTVKKRTSPVASAVPQMVEALVAKDALEVFLISTRLAFIASILLIVRQSFVL
jgi:hypothetical protein